MATNPFNQNPFNTGVQNPTPFDATPLGIAQNTIIGIPNAFVSLVGKAVDYAFPAIKPLLSGDFATYKNMLSERAPGQLVKIGTDGQPKLDRTEAEKLNNLFIGFINPTGGYGEEINKIAKEINPNKIAETLKSTFKITEQDAPTLSKLISKTQSPEEVNSILNKFYDVRAPQSSSLLKSAESAKTSEAQNPRPLETSIENQNQPPVQKYEPAPERQFPKTEESPTTLRTPDETLGKNLSSKETLSQAETKVNGGATPEESVRQLIQALKEAAPIRGQQEKLYTQARAERIAKVESVQKITSGEAGFHAELSQLKGPLPKAEFESLRGKISQDHIDNLFNMVRDNQKLDSFEKITARNGLSKMFGASGGGVPTEGELRLMKTVFPPEVVDELLKHRPLLTRLGDAVTNLLNVPRSIMSSFDFSAPFRQGVFMVGRKEFWKSFSSMFKQATSEKAFQSVLEEISSRPTFGLMKDGKLAIMTQDSLLTGREERFISNWAENIPGIGKVVRASGRAYTGFLNKVRADVFDDILSKAKSAGIDTERDNFIPSLGKFINSATGRGTIKSLEAATPLLNNLIFSPRLMYSRLNLLNPVYYAKLDPFVRKEALKSLLTFAGMATSVLTLAQMGGASVGANPLSADFGKIKMGNTRVDILGGFQQYLRLGSQLLAGKIVSSTSGKTLTLGQGYKPITRLGIIARFFLGKENPVASFISSFLQGESVTGQKFKLGPDLLDRFVPMITQDIADLVKDDASVQKLLGVTALNLFGVGTQTYSSPKPKVNPFDIKGVEMSVPPAKEISQYTPKDFQMIGQDPNVVKRIIQSVPFTEKAKALIAKTKITPYKLEAGLGGDTYVPNMREARTPLAGTIRIAPGQADIVTTHELFNSLFWKTGISPQKFNAAWETARKSNPDMKQFDAEFSNPDHQVAFRGRGENIDTQPYDRATERFAEMGKLWGPDGLDTLPKELQPFFKDILK